MESEDTAKLPRNIVSCLVTVFNFRSAVFCALFKRSSIFALGNSLTLAFEYVFCSFCLPTMLFCF